MSDTGLNDTTMSRAADDDGNEELDDEELERRIAEVDQAEDDDEGEDYDYDYDYGDERKKRKRIRTRDQSLHVKTEVDDYEDVQHEKDGIGGETGFIDEEDINDNASSRRRAAADNANLDRMRTQTVTPARAISLAARRPAEIGTTGKIELGGLKDNPIVVEEEPDGSAENPIILD
ncbi:hypothetical protein CF319_g9145 [Tilletia indica]|nr:hypothetical protein CF319_g9145 [Tilletia indica]